MMSRVMMTWEYETRGAPHEKRLLSSSPATSAFLGGWRTSWTEPRRGECTGPLTDLVLVRHGVNWPIANSGMCWEAFTRAAHKRRDSGHRYMAA